jgi:hypothetical protein
MVSAPCYPAPSQDTRPGEQIEIDCVRFGVNGTVMATLNGWPN